MGLVPSLNPFSPVFTVPIDKVLYVPLLYLAFPPENLIVPLLAKNVTHNSNYTKWTINLLPNLKWDNGQPLTSTDVAFTVKDYYFGTGIIPKSGLISVTNLNSTATVVTFNTSESQFEYELASVGGSYPGILPYSTYAKLSPANLTTFTNFNNIVASGPFVIYNYSEGTNPIIFTANEYYYRGPPKMSQMYLHLFSSYTSEDSAYVSDALDAIWESSSYSDLKPILNVSGYTLHSIVPAAIKVIMLNTFSYPFNLTGFRQALAYATNRSEINNVVNSQTLPLANYDILTSAYNNQIGLNNSSLLTYSYSLEKVNATMTSLGFKRVNNVWSFSNGKTIVLNITYNAASTDSYDTAQLLSTMWTSAGFKVTLNGIASSTEDSLILGETGWSIVVMTSYTIGPLPGPLSNLITPGPPMQFYVNNTTVWWNSSYYQDIINASKYPVLSSSANYYTRLATSIVQNSVPIIPLFYLSNWVGVSNQFYWGSPSNNTGIFNTQAMIQEQFWYGSLWAVHPITTISKIHTNTLYLYLILVIIVVGAIAAGAAMVITRKRRHRNKI